jgi:outer membrane protein TolC
MLLAATWGLLLLAVPGLAGAQGIGRLVFPEQRRMEIRHPTALPRARLPDVPAPATVTHPRPGAAAQWNLSLDEAIRTALANSEVVRVLVGATATSGGRTIYDPAISNAGIDQARGRFDPAIDVRNQFHRREIPLGIFDPADPTRALIHGDATQDYDLVLGLSKTAVTGGSASFNVYANPTYSDAAGLPLNPQTPSTFELGFTQPLLQGNGRRVNLAPIVLARIDTERSFFQFKDAVGEMVRGVIEAYWALVFARADAWARRQQVEQGEEALRRAEASRAVGRLDAIDVAEFASALANFDATRVSAETNVLQREAALRNIMGLPPNGPVPIVPVTPPSTDRLGIDWTGLLGLAEQYRPDLIELKLIIEADQQRLLMSRNDALPRVDAQALYRWNGLEGRTPDRMSISTRGGEFTGWTLGVNFSVPLGLRQSRAAMRQQELIVMRDRANLEQGLHETAHVLATTYRNLAQFYDQYEAFRRARMAARLVLEGQAAKYRVGQPTLYLNVRVAITDWGNAVSAESQALAQYNTELATLEHQTGTILESHGIRFVEERYGSIGPLGRVTRPRCYPKARRPCPGPERYPTGTEPAENVFDLDAPIPSRRRPAQTPSQPGRLHLEVPERIPRPAPER